MIGVTKMENKTNMEKKMNIDQNKKQNCENNVIFLPLIISALQTKCIYAPRTTCFFTFFRIIIV